MKTAKQTRRQNENRKTAIGIQTNSQTTHARTHTDVRQQKIGYGFDRQIDKGTVDKNNGSDLSNNGKYCQTGR